MSKKLHGGRRSMIYLLTLCPRRFKTFCTAGWLTACSNFTCVGCLKSHSQFRFKPLFPCTHKKKKWTFFNNNTNNDMIRRYPAKALVLNFTRKRTIFSSKINSTIRITHGELSFEWSHLQFPFTRKWTLFNNNSNSTIRMYLSRAFIWVVTPLGFVY